MSRSRNDVPAVTLRELIQAFRPWERGSWVWSVFLHAHTDCLVRYMEGKFGPDVLLSQITTEVLQAWIDEQTYPEYRYSYWVTSRRLFAFAQEAGYLSADVPTAADGMRRVAHPRRVIMGTTGEI